MNTIPNFKLDCTKPISNAFILKGIIDYANAVQYIKELPYGRNANKLNLLTVFDDNCGTCSTKHALLYQLAVENDRTDITLMMGVFEMDIEYAPSLKSILDKHHLKYIPEAHNYLLYDNQRVDCTNKRSLPTDFEYKLLDEQRIEANQIAAYKVSYHKDFLEKWLNKNPHITLRLNELWSIREECILLLSQ